MKDKFRLPTSLTEELPPCYDVADFRNVRALYAYRKLELLRKAFLHSLEVYSEGDYPEALLCFYFLKKELDTVISSVDSRSFLSVTDLARNIRDYISVCNEKILDMRKSSCHL